MPVIIEIRAGEGGKDSKLFIHDLASAYIKYASHLGLKSEKIYVSDSQVSLKVNGDAEEHFKHEPGNHCVQRVPPTENKGRRHTSYITVALTVERERPPVVLNMSEIVITTQRGSGKGGQKRNKTESCVRVKHVPTGIIICIDQERSQHQNKEIALDKLRERLQIIEDTDCSEDLNNNRRGHINNKNKIRVYNHIEGFAKDCRTNKKIPIKKFLRGNFSSILPKF